MRPFDCAQGDILSPVPRPTVIPSAAEESHSASHCHSEHSRGISFRVTLSFRAQPRNLIPRPTVIPSTAEESPDTPTLPRCLDFAQHDRMHTPSCPFRVPLSFRAQSRNLIPRPTVIPSISEESPDTPTLPRCFDFAQHDRMHTPSCPFRVTLSFRAQPKNLPTLPRCQDVSTSLNMTECTRPLVRSAPHCHSEHSRGIPPLQQIPKFVVRANPLARHAARQETNEQRTQTLGADLIRR